MGRPLGRHTSAGWWESRAWLAEGNAETSLVLWASVPSGGRPKSQTLGREAQSVARNLALCQNLAGFLKIPRHLLGGGRGGVGGGALHSTGGNLSSPPRD